MTHKELVIKRLNELLNRCQTASQRKIAQEQLDFALTASEAELALWAV